MGDLSRLSRLTGILTSLQSRTLTTAPFLSQKYDVSLRTIYRDIKALQDSGVPIYTEEGKGYKLVEGYTLPPIMFTKEEANALITAGKIIGQNKDSSLVTAHSSAIEKLRSVMQRKHGKQVEKISNRLANVSNLRKVTTSASLMDIQKAILDQKVIQITYHSLGTNAVTDRSIEPRAIYHSKDNWVMIGWCYLREAYREFRLDHIRSLQVTNHRYEDRPFDLQSYFLNAWKNSKTTPDIGLSSTHSRFDSRNQNFKKMVKENLEKFYVVGVSTRTSNVNNQMAVDIPAVWQRFMTEGISMKLSEKLSDDIYCVYTRYEGDHMAPYTTLVGHKVPSMDDLPEGMDGVEIVAGPYQKFTAKGDLEKGDAVVKVWTHDIWQAEIDRAFQTDFELYSKKSYPLNNGEADVYVGIK